MKQLPLNLKAIFLCTVAVIVVSMATVTFAQIDDPLLSWNDGLAKESIVQFVKEVTTTGSAKFVPPPERIAVFDNDGTLWAEQPMYFQLEFVFDRVKALAPMHPEWKQKQPFQAVLEGDLKTVFAGTKNALLELMMATHTGNTTEEFSKIVEDWVATAKHPKSGRRSCAYRKSTS